MEKTNQHTNYLSGKTGRIYVARNGSITVFRLSNGETWFCNNLVASLTIAKCVSDAYWMHSIDFAGSFSNYFTFGMAYDEIDRPVYPDADPIVELTKAQIKKLKR